MQSIGGWFGRQVDMTVSERQLGNMDAERYAISTGTATTITTLTGLFTRTPPSRKRERIYGNMSLSYKLTDWLSLMGRYGIDYYNEFRKSVYL